MNAEWVQGAYNSHEHDFTERTEEQLLTRLNHLHEMNKKVGYTGERLQQITKEMTLIAMELASRVEEQSDGTQRAE